MTLYNYTKFINIFIIINYCFLYIIPFAISIINSIKNSIFNINSSNLTFKITFYYCNSLVITIKKIIKPTINTSFMTIFIRLIKYIFSKINKMSS
ncbi:MAG: hypothetical protein DBX97_23295 [Collinsella tanakaei]|nr:MAG: hypothetical protein DBX97_23295 [Collinsella tanakaei]